MLSLGLKVVTLSERAAERVREIIADSDDAVLGLRVGVKNGGCAGMSYTLDYVRGAPDPKDEVVEDRGVRIFVDPKATLFLLGTQMDYVEDKLSSQFVFKNPNEISACGCGESVSLKPAEIAVQ